MSLSFVFQSPCYPSPQSSDKSWTDVGFSDFQSIDDLKSLLEKHPSPPRVIIVRYVVSQGVGALAVLSWIKREPAYHHIPIVVTADVVTAELLSSLKLLGAFDVLQADFTSSQMKELLDRCEANELDVELLRELDVDFSGELAGSAEKLMSLTDNLSEGGLKDIYQLLHTAKGGAGSLQFPYLGNLIHKSENLISALQNSKIYQSPKAQSLLKQLAVYLSSHSSEVVARKSITPEPLKLSNEIELFCSCVSMGWFVEEKLLGDATTHLREKAPQAKSMSIDVGSDEATFQEPQIRSSSVRVSHKVLDDIQSRLKKVLQTRTKMSAFANGLKAEFHDESFPNELSGMVSSLSEQATSLMEIFLNFRLVPISRLQAFCQRVFNQTVRSLNKAGRLEFVCDPNLELDQHILHTLESALTHLLRNSLDHGLESPEERVRCQKEREGKISIEIKKGNDSTFKVVMEDDGRGINFEKLKMAVRTKGIFSESDLNSMKTDQLSELIFLDGLSTQANVSETSGRGVGMGAVKAEIEDLGGTIAVTSIPNQGTRFVIEVPRMFKL